MNFLDRWMAGHLPNATIDFRLDQS
ncbi:hypothetical protein B5V01_21230 [Mesorhizobium erdmanii]|uniref:DUF768 domain-containing protein n=2 Tax=Mesorhizobium TaxID=68287 RepID=A0A3M9X120_9HYPH|nr:hypothetical protein DNR46_34285 [Mesorhizobium japonicum]RXT43072.1 hypothetical protein B5V01_21230 [Mesorhizobium erdmanii]